MFIAIRRLTASYKDNNRQLLSREEESEGKKKANHEDILKSRKEIAKSARSSHATKDVEGRLTNSSKHLKGQPTASHIVNNKQIVEKLFSPPESAFASFLFDFS
jgi:hypothetical protein